MAKKAHCLSEGQDGESDKLMRIHTYRKMKLVREFPVTALPLSQSTQIRSSGCPWCSVTHRSPGQHQDSQTSLHSLFEGHVVPIKTAKAASHPEPVLVLLLKHSHPLQIPHTFAAIENTLLCWSDREERGGSRSRSAARSSSLSHLFLLFDLQESTVLKKNTTFMQVQQLLHPSPVVLCSFLGTLQIAVKRSL